MGRANTPFALHELLPEKPGEGLAFLNPYGIHGTSQGLSSLVHAGLRLLWQPPVVSLKPGEGIVCYWEPFCAAGWGVNMQQSHWVKAARENQDAFGDLPKETFPLLLQLPEQRGLQRESWAGAHCFPGSLWARPGACTILAVSAPPCSERDEIRFSTH